VFKKDRSLFMVDYIIVEEIWYNTGEYDVISDVITQLVDVITLGWG
jgi:hypothetical protein